jgi:asparagine synthase (glutamine-hydrolysing)
MAIFGFLGPLTANDIPLPGAGGSASPSQHIEFGPAHGTSPCSISGPGVAAADDLVAVVQGTPRINGETQAPESAARALLDLYRQRGARCLEQLSGRFAVSVIDRRKRSAMLAIDAMGVERLAYAVCGDSLVFGTSAEQVARAAGGARLNRQAVFDYLVHHMVPAPITIFDGVRKLRAGNCAVFEAGRVETRRYWNPVFQENGPADDAELAGQLRAALRTAVRDAHPDAEAGAFLSGGLDSSTVAGILSEVAPGHARTFSIGFSYPEYDERHFARLANARFGTSGHEHVVMGDDIAAAFPLIARAYDEPFGNSSALPAYYCAKLARSHGVTHLLAGDGGDELFGGNSRYARQAFFQRYQKVPAAVRHHLVEPLLQHWPAPLVFSPIRKARNYVERANIPLPRRLELWNLTYRLGAGNVLHPDFLQSVDTDHAERQMDELWASAPCAHSLNRMLFFDWQYTLADNDLRKVETMSALAGVRVSYPMLHPDVIDVATRVPPELMLPGTKLRDFYKRAMSGFLPDEIINKSKHGFGLPFGLWLQDSPPLRELILGNLSDLQQRDIIHPQLLDRLLHLHGKEDAEYYGVFVWVLAMLEQWLTEHDVAT